MALKAKATQEFVPIKEIRDGVVVLKNGELRGVMLVNSMNLSLKSADEQKAVLFEFQGFLNTLDFPVQISVQSRRLDIKPYLLLLEERMKIQNEPLLKLQTREYINFIKSFTENVSIMTKNFFVIVPYVDVTFTPSSGLFGGIFNRKSENEKKLAEKENFEEQKSQLEERVGVVEQGLARCGLKSVQLNTEQMVEVFYKVFNPGEVQDRISL